jgi:serine/threonine-protein kinase
LERLQRYDLLERIASGGMGEVFRAQVHGEHGFAKTVAVKRILPDLARDPEFVVRFVVEAKLAVALGHANIVQVFDLGRTGDELFLVMEFVDGADLGEVLAQLARNRERCPLGVALHVGIEACKGLAYAHDRIDLDGHPGGVVHCDITPSNLMVSYAGEVKITDFGVAQMQTTTRRSSGGRVMGKRGYMAPEQQRGASLDARTDLYGLAVVLHEMLSGQKPTEAQTAWLPLRELRDDVPPTLSGLLGRALASDPDERPPSARMFLAELTRIARGLEPALTAPEVGAWVRERVRPKTAVPARAAFDQAVAQLLGEGVPNRTATATGPSQTVTFMARRALDGTMIWEQAGLARPRTRAALMAVAGVIVGVAAVVWWQLPRSVPAAPPPSAPVAAAAVPSPPAPSPPVVEPAPPPAPTTAPVSQPAPRPRVGWINIYADPWANVLVDGRKVGATPLSRLALPAGKHRFRFVRPGSPPTDRTVRIHAGQTQLLDVELETRAQSSP